MIAVNNLSIYFSREYLFQDISFMVNDKDRIGLVGKNGAGKSTLMKILAKQQEIQTGTITVSSGQTIGYLPQEIVPDSRKSILDEALTAFDEIIEIEKQIESVNREISERTDYESGDYEKLLTNLHDLNERITVLGGYNRQEETEKVLLGLGFKHSDFNRSMTEFSGGWQMRVELAKILLKKPDFLLLDEPTNHLDIESIQWLEGFLIGYFGTVILVSHDRTFLDNITTRTIEITNGRIYDYKASYSDYVVLMQERRANQMATLTNQQKEIAEVEKFIERFRYKASKAKQVQSKIKLLEKVDVVSVDEANTAAIHFRFPPAPHSGKIIVEMAGLEKKYGEKTILKNLDLYITKGDKIAFVGKNGEGKSTLSKIIVGDITDYSGVYKEGHQVQIGYFAQNQAALLDGEATVFETIDKVAVGDIRSKIRNILGSFLFGGDDVDKKVKVLSGGEKARLALAKLLLTPSNLLVLDEPTNHLDMMSKDVLKNALLQYDGTLIVVSHDRDFLTGLTDTIFEFKNQAIKEFKGDIFEFLEARKMQNLQELEKKVKDSAIETKETITVQNKLSYERSKEIEKVVRKAKNKVEKLETDIARCEQDIKEKEDALSTNPEIVATNVDFLEKYEALKSNLDKILEQWEIACQELEDVQANYKN